MCPVRSAVLRRISSTFASTSQCVTFRPDSLRPLVDRQLCRGTLQKSDYLKGVSVENREAVAEILDKVDRAVETWTIVATDFLTPSVLADALAALGPLADVVGVGWGGYASAERQRLLLGREEVVPVEDPSTSEAVVAVQVKGNFMFDAAKHNDFLGACLGTGIDRRKIGDILLQGETGAQILCAPEVAPFLEMELRQVRSVGVETQAIPLAALKVAPPKTESMQTVEASLRLDAIASAGFRMSRSRMSDRIKGGDVRVNWRAATKGSLDLKAGDVISCLGKGRVKVDSIDQNRNGKFVVKLVRYV